MDNSNIMEKIKII